MSRNRWGGPKEVVGPCSPLGTKEKSGLVPPALCRQSLEFYSIIRRSSLLPLVGAGKSPGPRLHAERFS